MATRILLFDIPLHRVKLTKTLALFSQIHHHVNTINNYQLRLRMVDISQKYEALLSANLKPKDTSSVLLKHSANW